MALSYHSKIEERFQNVTEFSAQWQKKLSINRNLRSYAKCSSCETGKGKKVGKINNSQICTRDIQISSFKT